MKYTRAVVTRHLECKHPAVATIWETGGTGKFEGSPLVHYYHIITIDERRFDVEVDYDILQERADKAAFKKIDQWLDEQYPEVKTALEKVQS